ncbi:unnamed protein product [Mytilus coruscus]|uniref:Uncharacterized protein n=1 Tax=Mytilus coruscus TaxID=42192 RepID=A0A6J8CTW3_MYTCO|nr:unnamed protein product [Mytilus coruscus]
MRTAEYKSKEGEVVLLVPAECSDLLGKRISYLIHREYRHEKAAQLIQRLVHSVLIKSKNVLLINSILQAFVNEEHECSSKGGTYSFVSFDDAFSRSNRRFSKSAFLPAQLLLYFAGRQVDEICYDIALKYITIIIEGDFEIDKKIFCKTIVTESICLLCAFGNADMVEKTITFAHMYCIPISHDDLIAYHEFGGNVISIFKCIEGAFLVSNLSVLRLLMSKYTLPTFNINEFIAPMFTRKTYSLPLESLKWLTTCQNLDKKIILKLSIRNNFESIADFFWDESIMLQSELINLFIECCKYRIYKMIPWMVRKVKVNRHDVARAVYYLLEDRFSFLDDSHEKQIVKILKIFFQEFDLSGVVIKTAIKLASENGCFEVVLLFFEKWSPCDFDLPAIFNEACEYCNMNMVQWVLDFVERRCLNFNTAFLKACGGNNGINRFSNISVVEYNEEEEEDKKRLQLVSKLWNCVDDTTTLNAEKAIEKACVVKRFHIIQWLLKHMKPEHSSISQVLQTSCKYGQLELVEWVLSNYDTSVVDYKSCLIWLSSFRTYSTITFLSAEGNNRATNDNLSDLTFGDTFQNKQNKLVSCILKNPNHESLGIAESMQNYIENDNKCIIKLLPEICDHGYFDMQKVVEGLCRLAHSDIVKSIFDKGNYKTLDMNLAMIMTCAGDFRNRNTRQQRIDLITYLWNHFDQKLFDLNMVIDVALQQQSFYIIEWILDNIDQDLYDINQIMLISCRSAYSDLVKYLINEFELSDFDLKTALIEACNPYPLYHGVIQHAHSTNRVEIVDLLLRHCGRNSFDLQNVLNTAHEQKAYDVVSFFLENNICKDLNIKILMLDACKDGYLRLVIWLLQNYTESELEIQNAFLGACVGREFNSYQTYYERLVCLHFLWDNVDHSVFDTKTALKQAHQTNNEKISAWLLTLDSNIS